MNRLAPPRALDATLLRDAVEWAIVTRRSIRAFLPTPVPQAEIEAILEVARHSASGVNTQPWHVNVVTGPARQRITDVLLAAFDDPAARAKMQEPYAYYPNDWISPYLERRRKIGWDLYGLLDIPKGDKASMHRQHACNYRFFDAPVGLFLTVDRTMRSGLASGLC